MTVARCESGAGWLRPKNPPSTWAKSRYVTGRQLGRRWSQHSGLDASLITREQLARSHELLALSVRRPKPYIVAPAHIVSRNASTCRAEVAPQHEHAHIGSAHVWAQPDGVAHLGRFLPRLGLHGHRAALFLYVPGAGRGRPAQWQSKPCSSVFLQCKKNPLNFVRRTSK